MTNLLHLCIYITTSCHVLSAIGNRLLQGKGNTALHVAVGQGRETIVECLLNNGAAVDLKDVCY